MFLWSVPFSLPPTIIFNLFLLLQLSEPNLHSLSLSADGIAYFSTKDVDIRRECPCLTSPKFNPPLIGTDHCLLILKDQLPPLLAKATCAESLSLSSPTTHVHLVLFQKQCRAVEKKPTLLYQLPNIALQIPTLSLPYFTAKSQKLFRIRPHFFTSHSFPILILPLTLLKFLP